MMAPEQAAAETGDPCFSQCYCRSFTSHYSSPEGRRAIAWLLGRDGVFNGSEHLRKWANAGAVWSGQAAATHMNHSTFVTGARILNFESLRHIYCVIA